MTAKRPQCVWCGKPYGQRTRRSASGEPMPPYRGNGVVTKTGKPSLMNLKADWIMHAYREVWDGETYWKPFAPFCTLRCALAYARNAHKRASE